LPQHRALHQPLTRWLCLPLSQFAVVDNFSPMFLPLTFETQSFHHFWAVVGISKFSSPSLYPVFMMHR
jgi:hypothetical protein